jgi:hypothetical protein
MLGSLKFQVRREPKSYQDGDDRFAEVADASITARRPDLYVTNRAVGADRRDCVRVHQQHRGPVGLPPVPVYITAAGVDRRRRHG